MDRSGGGGGELTATGLSCASCGTVLSLNSKFCNECGTPVTQVSRSAEFKQVTVMFADVVHSMDIAAAVGAERLREVMSELADRSAAVVKRYGGTLSQFTGDGIMAVFGAPVTLEDHAVRACLAALGLQEEAKRLATGVQDRDGIDLRLRVGLNSGQVIAGEIGSGTFGYTAVGEQVGMAQRMESVAPPGGVMLSESTSRLVENTVMLGEPERVLIKGADTPVRARRLLGIGGQERKGRIEASLVGRTWELNTVTAILDEAIGGAGCVVTIVGPAGIGKSRLVREAAAVAADRNMPVFTTHCESHASDIPFHVVCRVLSGGLGIDDLDAATARARVHDRLPDADPHDLLLLGDLLGVRETEIALPDIAPDAQRRRLTALLTAASLAQEEPALYVIEDAHWIDEVSESMLAASLAVIPQTRSLVLITHRAEYHGALSRVSGAQTLTLRPLSAAHTSALAGELLGSDPSLEDLAAEVATRAAGSPFFAEEIVRDLAERGVVHGHTGAYQLGSRDADATVPATLQATIGARIDRLGSAAKATLNAAAVIGTRFDNQLLSALVGSVDVAPLVEAELVDQVKFTARAEFVFRHPLTRAVAYESQLKSDRAQLHRRLAATIEQRDRSAADENAALIAEHLEAAGDLHEAFSWHMRSGTWSTYRNNAAAQTSWHRAQKVADRLPEGDPDRLAMRIAPRTLLCGNAHRVQGGRGSSGAHKRLDELRDLCSAANDQRSLAIGMAGMITISELDGDVREASRLVTELVDLLEHLGDPTLTIALSFVVLNHKQNRGEVGELLRTAQRIIDLSEGDFIKGNVLFASPLTFAIVNRGVARFCVGIAGWKDDVERAVAMARALDPTSCATVMWYKAAALMYGALLPDAATLRDTAAILSTAEQCGDDMAVDVARSTRGVTLVHCDGAMRETGFHLLDEVRNKALSERFSSLAVPIIDANIARDKSRLGDFDGAIELARSVLDSVPDPNVHCTAAATGVLVDALLQRGCDADLREAEAAIERLAGPPIESGGVPHQIWLLRLRALLAKAHGDEASYCDYRDRYRAMAKSLGFEGHMAWAEAMP